MFNQNFTAVAPDRNSEVLTNRQRNPSQQLGFAFQWRRPLGQRISIFSARVADPDRLGVTYLHEHLIIDSPLVADRYPHIHLPSEDEAVAEVRTCADAGVGTLVDALPCAAGRRVDRLAAASRRTGVHVVAVAGLHTARYYDGHPWTQEAPAEALADLFTADIAEGIDRYDYTGPLVRRTPQRAGMIKVATLGERPSPAERRAFEAAAETLRRTGAPILTHCEDGRGGMDQLDLLSSLGVPLDRVVLSHTDKQPDPGYHRDLLRAGANLEYDQALRQRPDEDKGTAWLLATMLAEGYQDKLLLGTDGARRALWRTLGGAPGLYSARYGSTNGEKLSDAGRRQSLLQALKDKPRPCTARFHATIAVAVPEPLWSQAASRLRVLEPAPGLHMFEGYCPGEIIPEERGAGLVLRSVAGGWRLYSHPDAYPYLERFAASATSRRLSSAALETLAVVAYRQPIARSQISEIRGVDSDSAVRTLERLGFIEEKERLNIPGNPAVYQTSELFLEKLGLGSLSELPPLADHIPPAEMVDSLEEGLRPGAL